MTRPVCKEANGRGRTCWMPATFEVYWQATGADARACCTKHLNSALRTLRKSTNGGAERTFKVMFIDA